MDKKTLFSRLFIFFVGLPVVLFIAWLPYFNHLGLHLLMCVFTLLGANELYSIFEKKTPLPPRAFIVTSATLLPVSAMVYTVLPSILGREAFNADQEIITYVFIAILLLILAYEVFTAKEFELSNVRMASSVFIVLYSGYLITFVSRMTAFTKDGESVATAYIATFLLMVFLCDSIAWFFGVLMGKNNKGIVAASPNKSVMGFIGGFVGSTGAGILAYYIWPNVFTGSIIKIIITGLVMAFSSIVGDLAESVLKRSSGVKDSGHIVPGRGGALDSLDSILMSAPVFYCLVSLFYSPSIF